MSEPALKTDVDSAAALEAEVDQAIDLCQGDVRAALRVTLVANAYLESEVADLMRKVSQGYSRGRRRKAAEVPDA
jgi:hypothetical protein